MKKTQSKRQRIPRRGPGVAELEKILKEQQGGGAAGQDSDNQLDKPISPPPPDYSSWSDLPSLPNLCLVPPPPPTAAENPVFTKTTPKLTDTQMINNIPSIYFPNFQFCASSIDRTYYSSMVNFIGGCGGSSAGRNNYDKVLLLEHPSSQRSTHFNHTWTSPEEQQQMVNAKKARGILEENHRDPNFQSRKMQIVSNMPLTDPSSNLEINPTAINFNSNFRGIKRGFVGQLMNSSYTHSSGRHQLAEDDKTNLMAPGCSSSPNQFASPFNFQDTLAASQHGDEVRSASSYDHNKITFNSLYESNLKSKSKGSTVPAFCSKAKTKVKVKAEVEEDDIDLDLKL